MKKKKASTAPFEPILMEELKNLEFAMHYLNDCLAAGDDDESFELFFAALGDVFKAQGITLTAQKAGITRDAFYKAFQKHKNPTLQTFRHLLRTVNMDIQLVKI